MSDKLAISSAFSVFLMASYVLLGGNARQVELDPRGGMLPAISAPAVLPQAGSLFGR